MYSSMSMYFKSGASPKFRDDVTRDAEYRVPPDYCAMVTVTKNHQRTEEKKPLS